MKKLTTKQILRIHDEQIDMWGGCKGIRDVNLFESQCSAPYQTFSGDELFPDVYDKAVRYMFGFATNQVFIDGNKRTAAAVALVYLAVNNIELDLKSVDLYILTMSIANHEIDEGLVKSYLVRHTI